MLRNLSKIVLIPLSLFVSGGLIATDLTIPRRVNAQQVNIAYFTKAPRLLGASTTFNGVRVRNAKYYFNIELPENAGNSLQKIAIAQRQGQETVKFRLEDTVAYIGTNRRKQGEIAISNVEQNLDTGAITVTLAESIPPGTTFTVGLRARENPFYSGVYLFGVTAFPRGNNPRSLYLGAGRLQFYSGGSSSFH